MADTRLVEYFKTWRDKGYSDNDIKNNLLKQGFDSRIVEDAMTASSAISASAISQSASSTVSTIPSTSGKKLFRAILLSALVLVVIVVAAYFIIDKNLNFLGSNNDSITMFSNRTWSDDVNSSNKLDVSNSLDESVILSVNSSSDNDILNVTNESAAPIVWSNSDEGGGGGRNEDSSSESDDSSIFIPTCNDGIQNQNEDDVDCGGPCATCITCFDGILNQDETGIDCGGSCVESCSSCDATCSNNEYCFNDVCLLNVSGNTYFVATTGDDASSGNFTHPFATFQKAINVSLPGDITYIRGGVYYPEQKIVIDPIDLIGASGTVENPIRYFNYPNENPVFDFINYDQPPNMAGNSYASGLFIQAAGNLQFKGLTLTNVNQIDLYTEVTVIYSQYGYNLHFENIVVSNSGGRGYLHETEIGSFGIVEDNTSFINCDAYNLADVLQYTVGATPGNQADGFKTYGSPGAIITYRGCRAWNVSDDGFDLGNDNIIIIDSCWSFNNGYLQGDGTGFKTGGNGLEASTHMINRIVKNNIAAANSQSGYFLLEYEGYYRTNATFYNNLAYANGGRGYFFSSNAEHPTVLAVYRNNIAYNNTGFPFSNAYQPYTESNNTWRYIPASYPGYEEAFSLTDADFINLDVSQLSNPREINGSLPNITFGHLASGSVLIDAGIDVGLDYSGTAPDIGAFEYVP